MDEEMEYPSLILPLPITKNICRTCLVESDSNTFMNIQDLIEHEMNKIKLIDILVFLNCLENNDEENWPQGMCNSCVSTTIVAYNFKLTCLKAHTTLAQILTIQSSLSNLQRSDLDSIDINVVYQDHEYDVPGYSSTSLYQHSTPKELAPLPPVTEITSTEHPPRKVGEKNYACNLCSKSYTKIYNLMYHMSKHSGLKKHLCAECGKAFHTSGGLRQHLLSHKKIAPFRCGFCNKTYKSRQSLKEHFRVAHSSNRKSFVCVMCGKDFTAKSSLMMHTKIHKGQKEFACSECPKRYTRASYLRIHSLVHEGQQRPRPFLCGYEQCERNFSTKHSLKVHMSHTHSAERPHKCVVCLKSFATSSALRIHRESHDSKNICNICDKKLANKRALQKHLKTHDVDDNIGNDIILETVVDNIFFDTVVNNDVI